MQHTYTTQISWTGNRGSGTSAYKGYDRTWDMAAGGKPAIACSNDPLLGGDAAKYNPEDLLLAALSSCHMLWYLHLCAMAGVVVTSYTDTPEAIGEVEADGRGRFLSALLKPDVVIAPGSSPDLARGLHGEVHRYCFIARSVSFPVAHAPQIRVG